MSQSFFSSSVVLLALFFLCSSLAFAKDVLRRNGSAPEPGSVQDYVGRVLEEAMRRTESRYGPYRIESPLVRVGREELLRKMLVGDEVNVVVVATQPSWEVQLLPIYIAPDMGISSYRIALTTEEGQRKLSAAVDIDQLSALRVGVGEAWSSRRVLEIAGFAVHTAASAQPLIDQLLARQIDYFPRGLDEVFAEFDAIKSTYPDLRVERDIVLKFPLPGYVFVSPAHPRLHKRLKAGLESMVKDGELVRMLKQQYSEALRRSRICQRRLFQLDNPNLFNPEPLKRRELWFDVQDKQHDLCGKQRRPSLV